MHRDVSLLEVIEALEGPVRLNLCLDGGQGCTRQEWCPAHPVWAQAQHALTEVLRGVSISDLAHKSVSPGMAGTPPVDIPKWN
jgi:DNA-binding IscR family transcriptional regulator